MLQTDRQTKCSLSGFNAVECLPRQRSLTWNVLIRTRSKEQQENVAQCCDMLLQSVSDFTNVQFLTSMESFSNNQQAKYNKTNTLINNVEQK